MDDILHIVGPMVTSNDDMVALLDVDTIPSITSQPILSSEDATSLPGLVEAIRNLDTILNPELRQRATQFLAVLDEELRVSGFSAEAMFTGSYADDGSFLIEWDVGPKQRLGFSIEADEKDSGWYYIALAGSGRSSASGSLDLDLSVILNLARHPENTQTTFFEA